MWNNNKNDYKEWEKIGKGTYGVVYKAENRKNGSIVAIKKIFIQNEKEGIPSTALREICILRELNHSTIIKLLDVIMENDKLKLILEYLNEDLKIFIDNTEKDLNISIIKKIMYQILLGINEMHSKRIIHRDLKPQNILLDKNKNVKITDFGLARAFSLPIRPYTSEVVTLWYRAPELLLGASDYSTPIDIWSAGCIFVELVTKQPFFAGDTEIDQLYRIFRLLGTPDEDSWPNFCKLKNYKDSFPKWKPTSFKKLLPKRKDLLIDDNFIDLIEKMLKLNPLERITIQQCLKHPFFKNLN